jgi:hypothetical protein
MKPNDYELSVEMRLTWIMQKKSFKIQWNTYPKRNILRMHMSSYHVIKFSSDATDMYANT